MYFSIKAFVVLVAILLCAVILWDIRTAGWAIGAIGTLSSWAKVVIQQTREELPQFCRALNYVYASTLEFPWASLFYKVVIDVHYGLTIFSEYTLQVVSFASGLPWLKWITDAT